MEKKYIIELPETDSEFDFASIQPYTESNLEQIRKEAFKDGYDAACKDIDIKSKTNAAYQKGVEDAWAVVGKILEKMKEE